jgi:hypothetical protein
LYERWVSDPTAIWLKRAPVYENKKKKKMKKKLSEKGRK